tara:strand:+ start:3401 stop:4117 length:717 start_codon:yes stop_codon:yes gene_type:complete
MKKIAFIIGNGTSRQGFDLRTLKPYGTIYGCNLLCLEYEQPETFEWEIPDEKLDKFLLDLKNQGKFSGRYGEYDVPDISVSMEPYRIEQHNILKIPMDRRIIGQGEELYESIAYHNGATQRPKSTSGIISIQHAVNDKGCDTLYLLGMDFIFDDGRSISNMFDGKKEVRASYTDTIRRVHYFDWLAQHQFPKVQFRLVIPDGTENSVRDLSAPNLDGVLYSVLMRELEKDANTNTRNR